MNIQIEDTVFEQYERIRTEGVCNMFDKRCVQKFAALWDMEELETTILDGHYVEILQGYGDWKERTCVETLIVTDTVREFLDAEKDTPEKLAQAIITRWWGKMDKAIRALEVLAEIQDENGQDTESKVTLAALHILQDEGGE